LDVKNAFNEVKRKKLDKLWGNNRLCTLWY